MRATRYRTSTTCLGIVTMRRTAFALIILIFTGPTVLACGSGMIMALVFSAYPEARQVFMAEMDARRAGLLPNLSWPGADIVPLHTWRSQQADKALERLKEIGCKTLRIDQSGAVQCLVGPDLFDIKTFLPQGKTLRKSFDFLLKSK